MLGLGKTRTARASATVSSAHGRVIYQRYAATLYRQALLTPDEDDARSRLAGSIFRRSHQLVTGLAQQDRRLRQRFEQVRRRGLRRVCERADHHLLGQRPGQLDRR